MNELNQEIVKAQNAIAMVDSAILAAYLKAVSIEPPQGRDVMLKATTAYLEYLLTTTRKLQSDLLGL